MLLTLVTILKFKAMKKLLLVLMIVLLGTLLGSHVMGQDNNAVNNSLSLGMPELNLLSSISGVVNLQLTTAIAGEAVASSATDQAARVKISSVVSGTQTRTLSAKVTTGTVPAGTALKLMALTPNSSFGGTPGTLVGSDVLLSTVSDANIITGIGSCYSGVAADDGYVLKYTWGLNNPATTYGDVRAVSGGTSVTVTLTLSAGI